MKFKQILGVKKQALQNAELDLNSAKNRKKQVELELENCKNEINSYKKANTIQEIQILNMMINNNLLAQEALVEKLSLCDKEIVHYEHLYKKASLDFEKIKFLYEEEVEEAKREKEKKEALALDEIATMRFFNANMPEGNN